MVGSTARVTDVSELFDAKRSQDFVVHYFKLCLQSLEVRKLHNQLIDHLVVILLSLGVIIQVNISQSLEHVY